MKNTKRHVSIFIPYQEKNDKILVYLQKKTKDAERLPGYFGFFGGGIEGNEKPKEALVREIKEELDYMVTDYKYLDQYNFPGGKKFIYYLRVDDNFENQITILEGEYGRYFTEDEALNEPKLIDEDKIVLEGLFKKIKSSQRA